MPDPVTSGSPATFLPVPPNDLDPWLNDDSVLIVDIRPPAAFTSARVPRAISLSVPSTLLKRPLFSLERLATMLSSPSARTRFSAWSSASRILVYDADSATISESSNIHGLLRKFNAGGFVGQLAWLKGGFHAIWRDRRDIIDALPPTPEAEVEEDEEGHDKPAYPILQPRHLPMTAFTLSSTTQHNPSQPIAAGASAVSLHKRPSLITRSVSSPNNTHSHPAFNPFFDTVRQNTELSHGITERIPLRLPRRVRRRIHDLPFPWLQDIARRAANSAPINKGLSDTSSSESDSESGGANPAAIEEGKEALAMQFFKIELSEQRRLMGIMEHHSKESGQQTDGTNCNTAPFPFSITAGVEKGAKNRYRHIWPFEHARVRLHQNKAADDDYINASYIQPLGTGRRYIATQGPLPATFADFWTLCWEQNVHVIVMLTREVEGAMIKCGTYWSDSVFGPLRLRLVSTEGVAIQDDRPASAGFFGQHTLSTRSIATKFPHSAGSHRRYKHHHYHNKRSETVKRVFELTNTLYPDAKPRRIVHFQYLEWPDMNVPDDPRGILGLIKQVEEAVAESQVDNYSRSGKQRMGAPPLSEIDEKTGIAKHALGHSPVLLHCSAGVGRTGGFIAVDAILDAIRREVKDQHRSRRAGIPMDVDQQTAGETAHTASTSTLPEIQTDPTSKVHMAPPLESDPQPSSSSGPETAIKFPLVTSQWAQNVSHETSIDNLSSAGEVSSPFNIASTPASVAGSSQTNNSHSSTYLSSSSSLGTSISGTSSSYKVNVPFSNNEGSPSRGMRSVLDSQMASPDHRLRTSSAPSGIRRLMVQPSGGNPPRHATSLQLDFSSIPKSVVGPIPATASLGNQSFNLTNLPVREGVSSEGEPPSRSESPSADETSNKPYPSLPALDPPHTSEPPPLKPHVPSPTEQQTTTFDYKEPRRLHEDFTPPPLSSFEDPIWEVIQDMREQRMSLCQSLRQYVFVHAAIIEGALMVIDEENEAADGLRPRPARQDYMMESPMASESRSPSATRTRFNSTSTDSAVSIGKRPSTPTELPKQNKQGEVMLSKRPSIKRKQTAADGLDHTVEEMRYHPVPIRATSSMVHAGVVSAPSSRSLPP